MSASKAAELVSIPAFSVELFRVDSYQWVLQWLPCQAPGVLGSAMLLLLVASRPSNILVYLRVGSAQTILRAATLI